MLHKQHFFYLLNYVKFRLVLCADLKYIEGPKIINIKVELCKTSSTLERPPPFLKFTQGSATTSFGDQDTDVWMIRGQPKSACPARECLASK